MLFRSFYHLYIANFAKRGKRKKKIKKITTQILWRIITARIITNLSRGTKDKKETQSLRQNIENNVFVGKFSLCF